VPYSVTLAPLTIAEGPLPPNTADIEHAQDVLVLCAKKRSQILDQINLLSFILAHQSSYDWTGDPTPTPASVDASLNGRWRERGGRGPRGGGGGGGVRKVRARQRAR
jgi:hypothetical protein